MEGCSIVSPAIGTMIRGRADVVEGFAIHPREGRLFGEYGPHLRHGLFQRREFVIGDALGGQDEVTDVERLPGIEQALGPCRGRGGRLNVFAGESDGGRGGGGLPHRNRRAHHTPQHQCPTRRPCLVHHVSFKSGLLPV